MKYKNNFRIFEKRFLLSGIFALVFFSASQAFAANPITISSLLNAFKSYVIQTPKPITLVASVSQADIFKAYKAYVVLAPTLPLAPVPTSTVIKPPTTPASSSGRSSAVVYVAGPRGPQGPQGPIGPRGPVGPAGGGSSMSSSSFVSRTSFDAQVNGILDSIDNSVEGLQADLVSGTNIKTINSTSLLGSGDITVQPTLVSGTNIKSINGSSILGSGDLTISGGGAWGSITGTLSDQTDLQNALDLKAPLASPTFTGTVTIPTPFTLGAVSVFPTGTELNFVDGVTSSIQTQLDSKLSSLSGAVLTDQTAGQTIGATGARLTKLWATDITLSNALAGSVTGNAGTVSNATLTTALTVNTGTLTLTANSANTSVLTIGAGAVSVSGSNTGDNAANSSTMYIGTTSQALNRSSAAEGLAGITDLTPGANFTLTQNSVVPFTSVETGAVVNTLYLKAGKVGIGTITPGTALEVVGSIATNGGAVMLSGTYAPSSIANPLIYRDNSGDLNIASRSDGTAKDIIFRYGSSFTPSLTIKDGGNVGIGQTSPTAVLHLKAGTATASTAPLKFTSGTLLATPEAGAVEFLSDAYYGTITTGPARKTFAFLESPSFTTPTLGVASATSLTAPTIIGGTSTTADLNLQTTSGVGATGADMHFLVGNNGGTEAMTILNSGNAGIGVTAPPSKLTVLSANTETTPDLLFTYSAAGDYRNGISNSLDSGTLSNNKMFFRVSDTFPSSQNTILTLVGNGNVGIGQTSPTAVLHLKAGTATASTAPLKFTSGTLLSTPEAGAVEFLSDAYYGTITTGAARKQFAFTSDITGTNSGTNTGDNATNSQYSGLAASKQDALVSGTNIKTINSTSLLGSGDIAVQPTLVSATNIKTINSTSLLGSGDVAVQPTLVSATNIKTINSTSLLGSGDISVLTSLSGAVLLDQTTPQEVLNGALKFRSGLNIEGNITSGGGNTILHFNNNYTDNGSGANTFAGYNGSPTFSGATYKFGSYALDVSATAGADGISATGGNGDWNFGTGNFTIVFWIYNTDWVGSQGSNEYLFDIGSNGDLLKWNGTNLSLEQGAGNTILSSSGFTPSTNTWYHFEIDRSGNTLYLFVNGTQVGTASYSGSFGSTGVLHINGFGGGSNYGAVGYYDDFVIVKGSALHTANFTAPSSEYSDSGSATYYNNIFQGATTQGANITYTLPTTDGTANQFLTTDGSGVLSWGTTAASLITAGNVEAATYSVASTPGADCTSNAGTSVKGIITVCDGASDLRLKKNITPLDGSILEKVASLQGVTFNWNDDYRKLYPSAPTSTQIGFIAQDVEKIFPELVVTNGDGYYGLKYDKFAPILTEAIKELNLNLEGIAGTITPLEGSANESFVTAFFTNIYAKVTTWMADVGNGIGDFFANRVHTKEICVSDDSGETCITRGQLDTLLGGTGISSTPIPVPEPTPDPALSTPEGVGTPTSENVGAEPPPSDSTSSPQASTPASPAGGPQEGNNETLPTNEVVGTPTPSDVGAEPATESTPPLETPAEPTQ